MCAKVAELPENVRKVLEAYPVRNPVKWKLSGGRAVLTYGKGLGKVERWLQKRIGGPAEVNRPLDDIGTLVWLRSDGAHTIAQICTEVHDRFGEAAEPVPERVRKFLELLLRAGLIRLSRAPDPLPEVELVRKVRRPGRGAADGRKAGPRPKARRRGARRGGRGGDDAGAR